MKSMTGYGAARGKIGKGTLFVELKSVNHRFNEVFIKIPGRMSPLEPLIRRHLQKNFVRGKIDIFFKEVLPLFGGVSVSVDTDMARKYMHALEKLQKDLGLKGEVDFLQTIGIDRILCVGEEGGAYEKLWGPISKLIDRASAGVLGMRRKEGAHILRDQKKRVRKVEAIIAKVSKRSKFVLDGNMKRVSDRIAGDSASSISNEQRSQLEVAAQAGTRQDIAEELVRLGSHIKQYERLLHGRDAIGKKLDFLLQEMNRETNTIGAKAADATICQMVVECKAELERLKEQVQNIE